MSEWDPSTPFPNIFTHLIAVLTCTCTYFKQKRENKCTAETSHFLRTSTIRHTSLERPVQYSGRSHMLTLSRHIVAAILIWQLSQHSPSAQVALTWRVHVSGTQQSLSHVCKIYMWKCKRFHLKKWHKSTQLNDHICDMIKMNESDVKAIDFEIQAKKCSDSFVSY